VTSDDFFTTTGFTITSVPPGNALPIGVGLERDGRIVVVGNALAESNESLGIVLMRYLP
jgi:hypothetical protein